MTGPTQHDDVVDALLSRHFAAATGSFEPPQQPSIGSLLPARRPRNRWWAPAAVAGGLIAAATATVLVVSSTLPSTAPKVGVAPSGPSASATGSTSNDEGGEPAAQITVRGQEYTLVGAVPWYSAMRIGTTVAVSTGPEIRGGCDQQIFRLVASQQGDDLVLTSYRYDPVGVPAVTECAAIALSPYVAAVQLDVAPPDRVRDGTRSSERTLPLTRVLVPSELPDGSVPQLENEYFPQVADPNRPTFPARPHFELGQPAGDDQIGQSYSGRGQRVSISQGLKSFGGGRTVETNVTVGSYRATLQTTEIPKEQCLRWTDDTTGKVEVCGVLFGGAEALLIVARSIYAANPQISPAPTTAVEPGEEITVNGIDYRSVGIVPWYRAAAQGNSVAVSAGPRTRGACGADLYRVRAARTNGTLKLSVTRYSPVVKPTPRDCPRMSGPPFVTAVDLGSPVTETSAVDPAAGDVLNGGGTDAPKPVVRMLAPAFVPSGFTRDDLAGTWSQLGDPGRPAPFGVIGPPDAPRGSAAAKWVDPTSRLTIEQGSSATVTPNTESRTTIHDRPATVATGSGGRCVRWAEPDLGAVAVCSSRTSPAGTALPTSVLIAVAQSLS